MEIFSNWIVCVILYSVFALFFNQFYKIATKKMERAGALTVLLEGLAGIIVLLFVPFFDIKFSSNIMTYALLGLAIIFYAMSDRLGTTVRSGIEASVYSMIKQLSTVFMIFAGLLFFKEPFILTKIVGAFLIIVSNVLVFFKKGSFKVDRYVVLGIIANLCYTVAQFIDVNNSEKINLPIYVALTLIGPAILIFIFDRVKIKEIVTEFKNIDKKVMIVTSASWGIMIVSRT